MVSDEVNPYAAPQGELGDVEEAPTSAEPYRLASRGQRLLGAVVDRWVLGWGATFLAGRYLPELTPAVVLEDDPWLLSVWILLPLMVLTALQSVLITLTGQSLGKRLAGSKIVLARDATAAGFWRGAGLREWVPLVAYHASAWAGFAWLAVIDVLPIFGNDRRCLHDYLAGTIVVRARRQRRREEPS